MATFEQKRDYYRKVRASNYEASCRLEGMLPRKQQEEEKELEIKATIIARSKSSVNGKEIVTFELIYPRFIHSELMTHRLFSRNAASSRAIPVAKMIEQVRTSPAVPCHWGKNQPGMQAKEELDEMTKNAVVCEWEEAASNAARNAEAMMVMGAHKQLVNRILEPFQMMKTVLTATEFDNFFWLRKHADAQPEIKVLAEKMWEALQVSKAVELEPGDWHTPYFGAGYWLKDCGVPLCDALAISSSCCAQVSYRLLDDSLEKAREIFKKLVESKPVHASPFEHQASPMKEEIRQFCRSDVNVRGYSSTWEKGITHQGKDDSLWSGNFKGWIQHRQLIEDNACWKYEE